MAFKSTRWQIRCGGCCRESGPRSVDREYGSEQKNSHSAIKLQAAHQEDFHLSRRKRGMVSLFLCLLLDLCLSASAAIAPNSRITFFGDSLTSVGGYLEHIGQMINSSANGIVLSNRAMGGATLGDIASGSEEHGLPSFRAAMEIDCPDLAVFFTGVNDIWRGVEPSDFEKDLERMANIVIELGKGVVIVTSACMDIGNEKFRAKVPQFIDAAKRVK